MSIGELAKRSGVSRRSLRYYEAQGLLLPHRTGAGHRTFQDADLDRVILIQWAFAAGLCSSVLRRALAALDAGQDAEAFRLVFAQRGRLADDLLEAQRRIATLDQLVLTMFPSSYAKARGAAAIRRVAMDQSTAGSSHQ